MIRRALGPRRGRSIGAAGRVVLVLLVALIVAGCGKKGYPIAPPGEPDTYPRSYPRD